MTKHLGLIVILGAAIAACNSSRAGTHSRQHGGGALELSGAGLTIDVPKGRVHVVGGDLADPDAFGFVVVADGLDGQLTLHRPAKPLSLEEAKTDAEGAQHRNIQGEVFDGGYIVRYEWPSPYNEKDTVYFASVTRTVGGSTLTCDSAVGSEHARQDAVAACKTLRPSRS